MSAGHRVRCTCWWLDVTAIDQAPHSSYVRGSGDPDCPAHPTVDLEPAGPPPVTPWVEFGEPEDRRITFRPARRRWLTWRRFWLAWALVTASVAHGFAYVGQWLVVGPLVVASVVALVNADRLTR